MNLRRVLDRITYPITVYSNGKLPNKVRSFFEGLASEFKYKMRHWQEYQSIRALIEDIFTLEKEGLSLNLYIIILCVLFIKSFL